MYFFAFFLVASGFADSGRGGGAEDSPKLSGNFPQGRSSAADDGRRRCGHVELPHLLQQYRDRSEVNLVTFCMRVTMHT